MITSAVTDGGGNLTVSGWFNTTPGVATYRLEFFVSSTNDPSGHGEGERFVGFIDVTTDANGIGVFDQTFSATVAVGQYITATATDGSLNTSEFSRAFAATGPVVTNNGIWMSTDNDVSASGAPGLDQWTAGDVLTFGGIPLQLDPGVTTGQFASAASLGLLGDGDVNIDGIHYVTQNVTIGSGANSIDLFAGDLLISTADDETFLGGTFSVEDKDLFLFRPVQVGNNSVGSMSLVLDMDSPSLSLPAPDPDLVFGDMWGVTLVEQDVQMGGVSLQAGEILFTRSGSSGEPNDVYVFQVTDAGAGVTDGTANKLVEGTALGFTNQIVGLDVIERSVNVGDKTLTEGSLLISLNADTTILDADGQPANDLEVERFDIVSLNVVQTELNGGTIVDSGSIVFQGGDVSLDSPGENVDAFTIVSTDSGNSAPTDISPDSFFIDELIDTTGGVSLGLFSADDVDTGETFTFSVLAGLDAAAFSFTGNELFFDESLIDDGLLDFEDRSSYAVNVQVEDGGGNTYDEVFTLNINDLNETPVVNNQSFLIDENSSNGTPVGSIAASDLDTGVNGNLNFLVTGGTGVTAFSVDGAGNITVADSNQLDFETSPALTLNIQVTDGGTPGLADTATITINVNDLNEDPVITSDGGGANASLNIPENTTAVTTVSVADEDLPGDTITYSLTGGADQSFFNIDSGGVLTFTSPVDFETPLDVGANNTYEVEVTVQDGNGGSDSQTITVTILDGNETPTTSGIPDLVVDEDPGFNPTYNLQAAFSDTEDLDSDLVYTVENITNPALFDSITINGSDQIVVDLANDQHGTSFVTVRATDTGGLFVETTFQVVINPVNDNPVINDQSFSIDENSSNGTLVGFVSADPGNLDSPDSITNYVITGGTGVGLFSIDGLTGEIRVADSTGLDFETNPVLTLTVEVTDAGTPGLTDSATITINLTELNESPVVDDQVMTIDENSLNGILVGSIVASDPDGGANGTFSIGVLGGTGVTAFAVDGSGNITVADATQLDFETNPSFTLEVVATDGGTPGLTDAATITVNLNDVLENLAPILSNNQLTLTEGQRVVLDGTNLSAIDADTPDSGLAFTVSNVTGGQFEWASTSGTAIVAFTQAQVAAGQVVFVDDGDETAPSYDVQVNDGSATDGPVAATIDFTHENDIPTLGNYSLTIDEGQTVTITPANLSATDVDNNDPTLRFQVTNVTGGDFEFGANAGIRINTFTQDEVAAGDIRFVHDGNESAPSFDVSVDDGTDRSVRQAANISFRNVNDIPTGSGDNFVAPAGISITGSDLLDNDFDVEGSTLTAALDSPPANGTVIINPNGSFVYTPNDGFSGIDSFTYVASDGSDTSGPITVIVEIISAAPAPTMTTTTPAADADTEEVEEVIIVPSPSDSTTVKQGGGADVREAKSIPLVAVSYVSNQTTVENVGKIEMVNSDSSVAKIVWRNSNAAKSTDSLDELSTTPRSIGDDLLDESGWFWKALDKRRGRMEAEANLPQIMLGSTAAIASTMTVGYLIWLVNGGKILAAVVTSLPTWSLVFDPLPILSAITDDEDVEDDSLESIIQTDEEQHRPTPELSSHS